MTLQGTQCAVGEVVGVIVLELAQQGDGHQLGRAFEQRQDFTVPDLQKWIDPRAPIAPGGL